MGANYTFYKKTKLTLDKNFIIEDIEDYLDDSNLIVAKLTDYSYQYVKHAKELFLKFNMTQNKLDMTNANDIEYMEILNKNDTKTYYYFVVNKTWKSENTIEMHLVMDTLNTFKWNTDYKVNKRTLVQREHKDRFTKKPGMGTFPLIRLIQLRSDGINPPVYKTNEERIYQNDSDVNWILYYRNKDMYDPDYPEKFVNDNPVECFIAPNRPVNSKYASGNTTLNASSFTSDGYYYLWAPNITLNNGGNTYGKTGNEMWLFVKSSSTLTIYKLFLDDDLNITIKLELFNSLSSIAIVENTYTSLNFYYNATEQNPLVDGYDSRKEISLSPSTTSILLDPSVIDRTDSRNIKIIELPYAPTEIEYDSVNDIYLFDGNWQYDTTQKLFKLINLETKFESEFESEYNPLEVHNISREQFEDVFGEDTPDGSQLRNDLCESKIYHSDYYRPKFVYDSFFITFQLEHVPYLYNGLDDPFPIKFIMSSNVISKFLFIFPDYKPTYSLNDFDNIVAVSRNNEQVIYSSQYINYIRTGYNYDLKTKQRNEEAQGLGLGLSIGTTALGVLGSVAMGNYGGAVLSAVAGGLSIANQYVNYAKSVAQTEQNIQQKLQEARMQSVSVMNADDVDLLNAYCGNKAKWVLYQVSSQMRKALLDMWYYTGYETFEQKVPNITSRYWFNALQCELVIDETSNIPDVLIEDIKEKFKQGATFFHQQNSEWDVDQEKENFETFMIA